MTFSTSRSEELKCLCSGVEPSWEELLRASSSFWVTPPVPERVLARKLTMLSSARQRWTVTRPALLRF